MLYFAGQVRRGNRSTWIFRRGKGKYERKIEFNYSAGSKTVKFGGAREMIGFAGFYWLAKGKENNEALFYII